MRRREPWYLFCEDAEFAESCLLADLDRCQKQEERASLLQLLSRLGAWDSVKQILERQPQLLAHAEARAALLQLRQAEGHPNPWLALQPAGEHPAFMALCQRVASYDEPVAIRLSGGLGDQLEAVALLTPLHNAGKLNGRIQLMLPKESTVALKPLLERQKPEDHLPPYRWMNEAVAKRPGTWLDLFTARALIAVLGLETAPQALFRHLCASAEDQLLVVCWRSKVDLHERLWAHLRSLPFREIVSLYGWLLPLAAQNGWRVADITTYQASEQSRLRLLRDHNTLDLASSRLNSFADTASLLGRCKLVLSVDTALIHLAHAMDIPRWLLLHRHPDARWRERLQQNGSSDRENLHVLQQTTQGQWQEPLAQLRKALKARMEA